MKAPAAGRSLTARFWRAATHSQPAAMEAAARAACDAGVGGELADQIRRAIVDLLVLGKGDAVTRLRPALALLTRGDAGPGERRKREGLA